MLNHSYFVRNISTVKKEVIINLQREELKGDILDAGLDNYGVIYNLLKDQNVDLNVEYVDKENDREFLQEGAYDTVTLFFSLSRFLLNFERKNIIKQLLKYLKSDGEIVVWDLDKKIGRAMSLDIKVLFPENRTKTISYSDYNVLKGASCDNTVKLLQRYFDIVELNLRDNIYYIKGRRKGRCSNESSIDSNQRKIYT
jgi:hypothetical protein